jgi:hypothetical protein
MYVHRRKYILGEMEVDKMVTCCSVFLRNSSKSLISVSGSHGCLDVVVDVVGAAGIPVVASESNLGPS